MGTFPIPPHNIPTPFFTLINMISTIVGEFHESYNPWIVPSSNVCLCYYDIMPLSLVELAYQAIQSITPSPHSLLDMSPDRFQVVFSHR
jgi:hypothetical protein